MSPTTARAVAPTIAPTIAVTSALLALLLGPLGARVAAAERLTADYEISWFGLEVGALEAELALDGSSYRLAYRGRTTGFLAWLFPFSSEGWSEGTRGEGGIRPARYQGGSRWRDEGSDWLVEFAPDGAVERIDIPPEQLAERDPVPEALQVGPDPLALIIAALEAAAPGVELAGASFDGRRAVRYDLACSDQRPATPTAVAQWGAPALACTIAGELEAGAHREWREGARPERKPAKVWLSADLRAGGLWPVLAELDSRRGTVTVELVRFGANPLAAAQIAP